eukprot:SAG31_NODE_9155_length_1324_cov_2.601633_1_plen_92_part_00
MLGRALPTLLAMAALSIAGVRAQEDTCAGDVNRDQTVDVTDLLELLGEFGSTCEDEGQACPADVNGDAEVNVVDLLALLGEITQSHADPQP